MYLLLYNWFVLLFESIFQLLFLIWLSMFNFTVIRNYHQLWFNFLMNFFSSYAVCFLVSVGVLQGQMRPGPEPNSPTPTPPDLGLQN